MTGEKIESVSKMRTLLSKIEELENKGHWNEADQVWDRLFSHIKSFKEKGMTKSAGVPIKAFEAFKNLLYPIFKGEESSLKGLQKIELSKPVRDILTRNKAPLWSLNTFKGGVPVDHTEAVALINREVSNPALAQRLIDSLPKTSVGGAYDRYHIPSASQSFLKNWGRRGLFTGGALWGLKSFTHPGDAWQHPKPGDSPINMDQAQKDHQFFPPGNFNPYLPGTNNYYTNPTQFQFQPMPTRDPFHPSYRIIPQVGQISPQPYNSSQNQQCLPNLQQMPQMPGFPQISENRSFSAPQWSPGSVSGVVLDPYGRQVMRTIPS